MLTSTVVCLKLFSYPIGNTPAANLLRDLRLDKEPIEILALGCGDVRNILFTLWSQQHSTCKLNFTTCDSDPAVLARNVFLLTAITQKSSSEEIECLWRTYYHFYVTSTDLVFVQEHCKKLDTADFFRQVVVISNRDAGYLAVAASKEDMKLWERLVPALTERCRSWEHTSDCKYKSGTIRSSVCDCGLGRNAEQMPSGWEDVAHLAIRIAIPLLSAVPYVKSVVDDKLVAAMTGHKATVEQDEKKEASGSASVSAVCDNCGSDKPDLKACTRCEKVKYCNHTCQKAAWKTHKKVCKR